MANPKWPAALQDVPNMDYSEGIEDGVIRSKPDVGPTMSRPRFTKTRVMPKMSFWVDKAQYEAFMDFYNIDLMQGCLAFDWFNPIKQTPMTLKFSKPPSVNYIGPLNWNISCEMEEV